MPDIDMDVIREALARRMQGGTPAGGGMPATDQMTAPMGSTPMGGMNTPVPQT